METVVNSADVTTGFITGVEVVNSAGVIEGIVTVAVFTGVIEGIVTVAVFTGVIEGIVTVAVFTGVIDKFLDSITVQSSANETVRSCINQSFQRDHNAGG